MNVVNTAHNRKAGLRSKEVMDLMAYLDLIGSDYANDAFIRIYNVPARKIGKMTKKKA